MADDSGAKDFLNAKATLTPGAAGAVIIGISTTCQNAFNVPAQWTAIVLSLCVALLVVGVTESRWWQKIILTVFNALVIFTIAFAGNQAGARLDQPASAKGTHAALYDRENPEAPAEGPNKQWFHDWLKE